MPQHKRVRGEVPAFGGPPRALFAWCLSPVPINGGENDRKHGTESFHRAFRSSMQGKERKSLPGMRFPGHEASRKAKIRR